MSFGIAFARRAREQFRALDPWLQEEVLDLVDRAASDPPAHLRQVGIQEDEVIDTKVERAGRSIYIFVTVQPVAERSVLWVKSIVAHVSAADGG